jgi:hypothetical protein
MSYIDQPGSRHIDEPAFPGHWYAPGGNGIEHAECYKGMSLLDYFATHALEEDLAAYIHMGFHRTQARFLHACKMLEAREMIDALRTKARGL